MDKDIAYRARASRYDKLKPYCGNMLALDHACTGLRNLIDQCASIIWVIKLGQKNKGE